MYRAGVKQVLVLMSSEVLLRRAALRPRARTMRRAQALQAKPRSRKPGQPERSPSRRSPQAQRQCARSLARAPLAARAKRRSEVEQSKFGLAASPAL